MAGSTSPTSSGSSTFSEGRHPHPFFAGDGRPVLLQVTERLEFVDAPGHVKDLERYHARGYRMVNNRIDIVTDHPEDLVEVHPPSLGMVDLGGVTIERCPPAPAMG